MCYNIHIPFKLQSFFSLFGKILHFVGDEYSVGLLRKSLSSQRPSMELMSGLRGGQAMCENEVSSSLNHFHYFTFTIWAPIKPGIVVPEYACFIVEAWI